MSLHTLANRLGDLGRLEEALAQAQEAVRIRRQLAEARPDAFLPNLARSLLVCGHCLSALERHPDAIEATSEAIRILATPLAQEPGVFAPLMRNIVELYLDITKASQQPPDMELLGPVLEVLVRLENPPAKK